MAGGRPTKYSQELADNICEQIATTSKSMKTICAGLDMNVMTVLNWLCESHEAYKPEFCKMYARAKEMQADLLAEEILDISDDSSQDLKGIDDFGNRIEDKEFVNRSKVRIDARKWIASKLKPKKYGEKIQQEHSGDLVVHQITGMEIK